MYKLPRGRSILENIKIEFINFDNVLTAGKRDRANKIDGYISLIYPEYVDFLFLKQGDPYGAIRFFEDEREQITIKSVVDKVKNAEIGIISIYEIPEVLIDTIISTVHIKPIINNATSSTHNPDSVINKIETKKFSGFMEVKKGNELFYIMFEDGDIKDGYFAEKLNVVITFAMLKKIMESSGKDGEAVRFSLYEGIYDNSQNITPADQELMISLFNKMMDRFIELVGAPVASNMYKSSYASTIKQYPIIKNFKIKNELYIEGEVIGNKESVSEGFGFLTDKVIESFVNTVGEDKVIDVIKDIFREYRFALKRIGFLEKAKYVSKVISNG